MPTNEELGDGPAKDPKVEATKTTGRMTAIGAISVIITYLIGLLPVAIPANVTLAVVFLIGVAVDNYNHNTGGKLKVPF